MSGGGGEMLRILSDYREAFLRGIGVTLELAGIIWIVGIVLGILLGALADKHRRLVGTPMFAVSFFLSGVPILVLLFWAHFPLQVLINKVINPFFTAASVLTIVNVFAVGDILRHALRDFPEQYVTAARVCGLDSRAITWKIKFPIVLRQVIPPMLTSQVVILQATLFASLISVEEIFRVAQRVNASAYKPVEIYTALALFFLVICLPINGLALWFKARFTRDLSER